MSDFPIIQKPRLGDPCNRCGMCCENVPCPAAKHLTGQHEGSCKMLERNPDGTSTCGLAANPLKYVEEDVLYCMELVLVMRGMVPVVEERRMGDVIRESMEFGLGCDSADLEGVDSDVPEDASVLHVFYERLEKRGVFHVTKPN